jgi:hypothetical protein
MFQIAPPATSGFLDPKTIGAFTGATTAVTVVTAVARRVLGLSKPWVPFVLSLAISFALAHASDALSGVLGWVIAFVNACLLFCAVVGVNEGANDVAHPQAAGQGKQQGAVPKTWLASFFHKPSGE